MHGVNWKDAEVISGGNPPTACAKPIWEWANAKEEEVISGGQTAHGLCVADFGMAKFGMRNINKQGTGIDR